MPRWTAFIAAGTLALGVSGLTVVQSQTNAATAIKAIDVDCGAIQDALPALTPMHFIGVASTWKVASDADVTVAERTHRSLVIADVWSQGKNFAWVRAHAYDQQGDQRATQLCFRQQDGSLERARQAATSPELNAAAAEQAYFASDGSLIQKTAGFEVNDPVLAKKVEALPFYKTTP